MNNVNKKNIFIASDHAGFELKEYIVKFLETNNYSVNNLGCNSNLSVDYPDFAVLVANSVKDNLLNNKNVKGILVCGTGSGMAITANKIKGIRAVNCLTTELADMAIKHNDANILCIGARIVSKDNAIKIVETFLNTDFEGDRHQIRIDKIHKLTNN